MRRIMTIVGSGLAALAISASAAQAQFVAGSFPVWWPTGELGAGSTPAGAYGLGAAAVIRAQGAYDLQTSEAAINYEKARRLYMDNHKAAVQNYFALKELNQAKQAEERARKRRASETLAAAARVEKPDLLGPGALNPHTGRIVWPVALMDEKYAFLRAEMEQLMEDRATTSGGPASLAMVHRAVDDMVAVLQTDIRKLRSYEYIEARKFLERLDYTASQFG